MAYLSWCIKATAARGLKRIAGAHGSRHEALRAGVKMDEDGEGAAATPNITAETAEKFGKSLQEARDLGATSYDYVRVNDLDLKQIVVPYSKIISDKCLSGPLNLL